MLIKPPYTVCKRRRTIHLPAAVQYKVQPPKWESEQQNKTDHFKPHNDTVGFIAEPLHHFAFNCTDVLCQINWQHRTNSNVLQPPESTPTLRADHTCTLFTPLTQIYVLWATGDKVVAYTALRDKDGTFCQESQISLLGATAFEHLYSWSVRCMSNL